MMSGIRRPGDPGFLEPPQRGHILFHKQAGIRMEILFVYGFRTVVLNRLSSRSMTSTLCCE
jgi:hypothetical protein